MPIALIAAIAIASLLIGFGGGWGVKHWKDGAEIAKVKADKRAVESQNSVLVAANAGCATDIESVKRGVAVVVAHTEEREKAASVAMRASDVAIAKRTRSVMVKALPTIATTPDAQCAAIVQEQLEYVRERQQ